MKHIVSLMLIILVLAGGAWAQIGPATNSFRNASTTGTGLLEDDLDLLVGYRGFLDPSRIPLVQGKRLYTSLADIVEPNKNEQPFSGFPGGTGTGYFLIGGSTKLMNYGSVGGFYDRLGQNTPDSLGFLGYGGMVGHGELTDVSFTSSGGQVTQNVIKRTADAEHDTAATQVLVGLGRYVMETKRVGLAFYHSDASLATKAGGDTTQANRFGNFTYDQTATNLVTNEVTLTDSWKGTETGGNKASQNLIGLSGWMPYHEKFSFGLQLMGGLVSTSPQDDATYSRTFSMPQAAPVETATANGLRKRTFTSSGFSFDGRLSGIYKWSDATESRVDFGLGMTDAKNKSGDMFQVEQSNSFTGTYFASLGDTDHTAYSGTKDNAGRLEAFARTTSKLSDRITFGIGVGVLSSNLETKLIGDENHNTVLTYRQNAGGPPSPFDSTVTTTDTLKTEYDTTASSLDLFVPVGLEFHLTDPIVFRLGAIHQIVSTDATYNNQVVSWSSPVTHVTVGDGRNYVTTGLPGPFASTSNTVQRLTSRTTYTYGAGWNYSDRLQLDFMGFANLTNLTNWRLSATFKF